MKKIVGNKVRASQGGESLYYELGVYYSNSLNFIAVKAHVDVDLDVNKSKIAGIKIDNKIIFQRKFNNVDIITDALNNKILSKWVIFHNGNIDLVFDYLQTDMIDSRLRRLEKSVLKALKEGEKTHTEFVNSVQYEAIKTIGFTNSRLSKIPIWIRRIFRAI